MKRYEINEEQLKKMYLLLIEAPFKYADGAVNILRQIENNQEIVKESKASKAA